MTRSSRIRLAFGIAFAAVFVCNRDDVAWGGLIVNGSFESPLVGGGLQQRNAGENFGGWVVSFGNIDHIHTLWQAADGVQSLDLNGNTTAGVYQDIATVPGVSYSIRFAYAGNPAPDDKRFEVLWDGVQIADITFDQNGQTVNNMGWIYTRISAVAVDSDTRLTFNSLTGATNGDLGFLPWYGPALDDVSVYTGDFDHDGDYDCADVDALVGNIAAGTNGPLFDLTGDGLINREDLDTWLIVAGNVNLPNHHAYLHGDANLDGGVDGSDFGIWNAHKFTTVARWCSGDFNADGGIDGSDFSIWNSHKFTSADGSAIVPEPFTGGCLCWCLCWCLWLAGFQFGGAGRDHDEERQAGACIPR